MDNVHLYMYIYVYICIYIWICVYIHLYIRIYMHIYIGICAVREELYGQCMDEIIRHVALDGPERGTYMCIYVYMYI
jgi:hypothetical protein